MILFLLWCNTITYQAAAGERDRERAVVMDTEQSGDEPLQRKSYHRQQQRCGGAVAAVVTYYARCWLGWCRHCTALRRILMENATFTKTGSAETKEHWALGHWVVSGRCTFVHRCHLHHSPTSTIFRGNLTIFGEGTSAILVSEILVLKP